jgi:hypothetical protein
MKKVLVALSLILSTTVVAAPQKIVYTEEILLESILFIQGHLYFEGERMLAGNFEAKKKTPVKKSYFDGLRSKLEGHNSFLRL